MYSILLFASSFLYFNKNSFLLFKAATLKLVTETKTYDVLSDNRLLPSPDRHHLSTSGYNWTCLVVSLCLGLMLRELVELWNKVIIQPCELLTGPTSI